jgi:KDO2-lipid IV(A) lauroyltransferase
MKEWLEFVAVWLVLKKLGVLPRRLARGFAASVTGLLFSLQPKLRKTAEFNFRLAFPDWTEAQRKDATRKMVRNLGWMAAEFARFPRLTRENIEEVVILEGHENFLEGQRRGKGVPSNWPMSGGAFFFLRRASTAIPSLCARPLDNQRLDALCQQIPLRLGQRTHLQE